MVDRRFRCNNQMLSVGLDYGIPECGTSEGFGACWKRAELACLDERLVRELWLTCPKSPKREKLLLPIKCAEKRLNTLNSDWNEA
jgi:hypothetical protein